MGKRTQIHCGPPKGVRNTQDPYDQDPAYLVNARNGYIPDPDGDSGWYARPGFALVNSGAQISSTGRAQGGYAHTNLDGEVFDFVVIGGKLYRADTTLVAFTDVTPVGITIDAGATARISFASLAGEMIVSDGVNPPWIASSLDTTPIVGTAINFDGAGTDWSAQWITVYSGALVVLMNQLDGTYAKTDIAWSAPGDASIGYQQANYDYRWTLEQTGSAPIYAIHGTNVGLYYWRQRSIGVATGALGPHFQTTHTDDAVADNVGTQSPQCIQRFENKIFFIDQIGRPWMLPLGSVPKPIWQDMRTEVAAAQTSYQAVTEVVSTAAIEPTLNLYLVAIWSALPSSSYPCVQWFAFDTLTGRYMGPWSVTTTGLGKTTVECLSTFLDNVGRAVLMVFGSKDAGDNPSSPPAGGYAWSFNALLGTPDFLCTEDLNRLTTEDNTRLTTEGQEQVWTDNGVVPDIFVTTDRLGYSTDTVWNFDSCSTITNADTQVSVTITTTTVTRVEGSPAPSPSQDGTYRLVAGLNVMGRGASVTTRPLTADTQWVWQQTQLVAIPSLAGPSDA